MMKLNVILIVSLLLGYGCASSLEPQKRPIALAASVGDVLVESELLTKAGGDVSADPYAGVPASNNLLDVALWFSFTPGSYSHSPSPQQNLPCATTVNYAASTPVDIRHDGQLLMYPIISDSNYDEVGDNVYCVGFSPSTGWGDLASDAVSSASHVINGSEDLMFADQMSGTYSSNFGTQTFRHLLTWVKINMNATSIKTAEVWGDVESLEIVSPNNTLSVSFSNILQDGVPEASEISYGGTSEGFQLAIPNDRGLSVTTRTFGQAFCSPPASAFKNSAGYYEYLTDSEENLGYIVKVRTSNIPEKEVFVTLKKEDNVTDVESRDYAVGKLFVITLHFNDVAVVEGVCTLRQWDDQRSDIYLQ